MALYRVTVERVEYREASFNIEASDIGKATDRAATLMNDCDVEDACVTSARKYIKSVVRHTPEHREEQT